MNPLACRRRLAGVLFLAGLASAGLAQSTWYVDCKAPGPGTGSPDDPYRSIQYAAQHPKAQAGDVLLAAPGVYYENVTFDRHGLTLRSSHGPTATILHARDPGSALVIRHGIHQHPTLIEGFTLVGGTGSEHPLGPIGGSVFLERTDATLVDCVVGSSHALRGGALAAVGSQVTLQGVLVDCATAELAPGSVDGHGGGLFLMDCPQVTLVDCTVSRSQAGRGGGIYAIDSQLELEHVLVENNSVSQGDFLDECGQGGGLYVFGGGFSADECTIENNHAPGSGTMGGGARLVNTLAHIRGGSFERNSAGTDELGEPWLPGDGGALAADCELLVEGTRFAFNTASDRGGAIHGQGRLVECSLFANTARHGGGAWTSMGTLPSTCFFAALLLERCEIVGNEASGDPYSSEGGGVCGPAFLERCLLAANHAQGSGGGAAFATLLGCVVEANEATPAQLYLSAFGGGTYMSFVDDCVIRTNRAVGTGEALGCGGGVYGGTLQRTVITGNEADFGAGVAVEGSEVIDRVTVWGNKATYAGGGVNFVMPGRLCNAIVYSNEPDSLSGVLQRSEVIWSDIEGGCPGEGNEDLDPCFWAPELGDFHLLPGSPCIDSGNPASAPDPDGSRADKGALPFVSDWCGSPVTLCQASPTASGCSASIGWQGTPSASGPDDFVVQASDVPVGRPGILWLSTQPGEVPFHGGVLCLGRPLVIVGSDHSGGDLSTGPCSGSFAFPLSQTALTTHGLGAGRTVFVQAVYRDRAQIEAPDLALTDALRFTLCP